MGNKNKEKNEKRKKSRKKRLKKKKNQKRTEMEKKTEKAKGKKMGKHDIWQVTLYTMLYESITHHILHFLHAQHMTGDA